MHEYYHTHANRITQLSELCEALQGSLRILKPQRDSAKPSLCIELLWQRQSICKQTDFDQAELSKLNHAIPDLFHRHRDWIPPLVEDGAGGWRTPAWFDALDQVLQPVLAAAAKLRQIGYA